MVRQFVDSEDLTTVANAIRTKGGTTAPLQFPDGFVTAVQDISSGQVGAEDGIIDRNISGSYSNDRVTAIGDSVFKDCWSLATVDFPNVTSIGVMAFSGCTSLDTADFSEVTEINPYAFKNCESLDSLIIRTPTVCKAFTGILTGADRCKIYVPDDLGSEYATATNWSKYANRIFGISNLPPDLQR